MNIPLFTVLYWREKGDPLCFSGMFLCIKWKRFDFSFFSFTALKLCETKISHDFEKTGQRLAHDNLIMTGLMEVHSWYGMESAGIKRLICMCLRMEP